jgi:Cu/Ag efflux protein CusF
MKLSTVLTALALLAAAGAQAQATPASAPQAAAAPLADAEVRRIDREQGKLTLRHGPLPQLDMPAMTMVFRTADPKLLDGLKEGDKVRFAAEKVNGAYTVTAIEPAR